MKKRKQLRVVKFILCSKCSKLRREYTKAYPIKTRDCIIQRDFEKWCAQETRFEWIDTDLAMPVDDDLPF